MRDLSDLIARVETATADDDVGTLIILASMRCGWANADWWPEIMAFLRAGAFTDAMLALVERCLPGWRGDLDVLGSFADDGTFGFRLFPPDGGDMKAGEASTPPLAILLALLRALQSQEPSDG